MSDGIMENDHAFYGNREPAWHRKGTVIDADVVTSSEAMSLAKLDWTVEQHTLYANVPSDLDDHGDYTDDDLVSVPGKVANVRMDTREVLGIVTPNYHVIQNSEAFDFFDELIGRGDAHYHTAGSLYNGRKVWALARLNRDILIGGDADEKIDPFICLANGHDGSPALSVYTTPIRVVCQNTLQWSIKGTRNVWRGKHTRNIKEKTREAREVLGFSNAYFDELQRLGDTLINQPMSDSDFGKMLEALVPLPTILPDQNPRGLTIAENTRADITHAWNVDNIANVKNTRWGCVQAVAEYTDWMKTYRSDDKFLDKNILGANTTRTLKDMSVDLALSF